MKKTIEYLGYAWLQHTYGLNIPALSRVAQLGPRQAFTRGAGYDIEVFPRSYARQPAAIEHMVFALTHEGVNLSCLERAFQIQEIRDELTQALKEKPSSGYLRRLWFICEQVAGHSLALDDALANVPYEDLIPAERYFVGPSQNVRRYKVRDNLFGTPRLSVLIERASVPDTLTNDAIQQRMHDEIAGFPTAALARAALYIMTSETRSSYAIEQERAAPDRIQRFIRLLEHAGTRVLTEEMLLDIHRIAVGKDRPDPSVGAFRYEQNWLGRGDFINLLPPPPERVPELMERWFEMHERIQTSNAPAIVKANAIAHSFIYIHPFMDGNGRLSRFLMQDVLASEGLRVKGIILPLSAGLQTKLEAYIQSLDSLSTRLMSAIQYEQNYLGEPPELVRDNTHLFTHLDLTEQQAPLNSSAELVLSTLLHDELTYLVARDALKERLNTELDLSNRDLELLIAVLYQNGGKVSKTKRQSHFALLNDQEVLIAEEAFDSIVAVPGEAESSWAPEP
nr:Fic family protein [Pseudomonas luteola]